jgi:hypothetical protein
MLAENEIQLTPVESSNIAAIGYDEKQSTLAVKFNNGAIWHYGGVAKGSYESLMTAASKGSYFARNIKPKHKAVQIPAKT